MLASANQIKNKKGKPLDKLAETIHRPTEPIHGPPPPLLVWLVPPRRRRKRRHAATAWLGWIRALIARAATPEVEEEACHRRLARMDPSSPHPRCHAGEEVE
jgi:hypothetical protein